MQHASRIANAAGIEGHIDDLALDVRRLPSVGILEEKRPAAIWARPAPIPLLALPCRAMAYNIRPMTMRAVQHLITIRPPTRVGVSLSLVFFSRVAHQHL